MTGHSLLQPLFGELWRQYCNEVSYARRYRDLVESKGGKAVNDHIAFRTFNVEQPTQPAGREALVSLFENLGYHQANTYDFPENKLQATHLEHPENGMPKLFVSQLAVDELSESTAKLIKEAVSRPQPEAMTFEAVMGLVNAGGTGDATAVADIARKLAAYFRRQWQPPLRSSVLAANEESQYAAWTLLHGNSVNHFTAFINDQNVAEWHDIEETVGGLRAAGIPMKDDIEGSPGSKLRQSSTAAVRGEFPVLEDDGSEGRIEWTYAYYELAERGYVTEDGERRLFSGFLGPQTPGLFNMTKR